MNDQFIIVNTKTGRYWCQNGFRWGTREECTRYPDIGKALSTIKGFMLDYAKAEREVRECPALPSAE